MDRIRGERYQRLESSEDIAFQPQADSIQLTEYGSQQDAPPSYDDGHKLRKCYSRSIFSNISDPFKDSNREELENDELHTLNLQKNRKHVVGWRMGAVISACTAGTVLLVNLIFLVVAMVTVGQEKGIGTLYKGDCNTVKRWDTIVHLILNLLGVAILAASNFTVQCISSPTREEVDKAHARRRPLDIGIPSVWNLRYMSWSKIMLWFFLMLSTLPLHLLWNSSIFSTIQTNEFTGIVVTPEFLSNGSTICDTHPDVSGANYDDSMYSYQLNCSLLNFIRNGYSAGNYTMLTPSQCISVYGNNFLVGHRNVIAVMNTSSTDANYFLWPPSIFNESVNDGYSMVDSMPQDLKFGSPVNDTTLLSIFQPQSTNNFPSYQWLCNYYTTNGSCTTRQANSFGSSWQILPTNYPIETCYSEAVPPLCKLEYGSRLVGIVLICNIVKTVCMSITAWWLWRVDNPILATIGDATASFLEMPDRTTKGCCLMDKKSIKAWKKKMPVRSLYKPPRTLRFFRAASLTRWSITLMSCLAFIAASSWLCAMAVVGMDSYMSVTQVWEAGFGSVNPTAILDIIPSGQEDDMNMNILANVLVANSPQLVLSITYFMYNAIYTAQLGAHEWNEYASRRKPLRVSFPRGNQISTYWLQLPFWYSVPLSAALATLHYLISQSIFFAYIEYYDTQGDFVAEISQPSLGYSPIAILASIILGSVVILALIINGFRKLNPAMPLMGNNSAIISAASHPDPTRNEEFLPFKRVRWGATSPQGPEGQPGHCAFTSEDVPLPRPGQFYE